MMARQKIIVNCEGGPTRLTPEAVAEALPMYMGNPGVYRSMEPLAPIGRIEKWQMIEGQVFCWCTFFDRQLNDEPKELVLAFIGLEGEEKNGEVVFEHVRILQVVVRNVGPGA
jgi:hypothetical protein